MPAPPTPAATAATRRVENPDDEELDHGHGEPSSVEGQERWREQREDVARKWKELTLEESRGFSDDKGLAPAVRNQLLQAVDRHHVDRAATALAIEEGRVRMPAAREELRALQEVLDEELDRLLTPAVAGELRARWLRASERAVNEMRGNGVD